MNKHSHNKPMLQRQRADIDIAPVNIRHDDLSRLSGY
jgi:hypothetical protein